MLLARLIGFYLMSLFTVSISIQYTYIYTNYDYYQYKILLLSAVVKIVFAKQEKRKN